MIELLVAADDRTGACETAGAVADRLGTPVVVEVVRPGRPLEATGVIVVDLDSRHLDADSAGALAAALELVPARRRAHKLDSTLRGRWAAEVVAARRARGGRVLVVAALPAQDRVTVGGIVLDQGRPVSDGPAGRDPRSPVRSSRPADQLVAAGADRVDELAGVDALARWHESGRTYAVADASTECHLDAIGTWWRSHPDVMLVGTSAVVAAAAGDRAGGMPRPALERPALVVCGSQHPAARAQLPPLASLDGVEVLAAPPSPDLGAVSPEQAVAVARQLAERAWASAAAHGHRTLVLVGGDTAAAVLGARRMAVGGTMAPGTPWGRFDDGGPIVVTRSGGFGDRHDLVRLLSGRLTP